MNVGAPPPPHSRWDDTQGLVTGCFFVALGLALFGQVGLVTGGVVGLAFLAHYATGAPWGLAFFAINLPFYALAWRRMGRRFTLKTFVAVLLLSLTTGALPALLRLQWVQPLFAAVGGGVLMGAGLLILFRHHASLGGMNIVVLWLQERRGWRAGHLQAGIDIAILLASTPWLAPWQLVLSVVGALALNGTLAVNHRPGRYEAV